jgi:thioesterase domain-containing protein
MLRPNFISSLFNPKNSLVAIKSNGSNYPIFFIPGAVGSVFYLYHLARHLDKEQPFYGLQAKGSDGKSIPHKTVNEAASTYIDEIKLIQPQGPYLLGGHSYGSYIAFEMAVQLQKQGEKVAFVGVIDILAPFSESVISKDKDVDDTQTLRAFSSIVRDWSKDSFEVPSIIESPKKEDILIYLKKCINNVNPLLSFVGEEKILGFFNVLKASLNYQYKTD